MSQKKEKEKEKKIHPEWRLENGHLILRRSTVNDCLSCHLCGGYLRRPVTICECLHTFCRECLENYVTEYSHICPKCGEGLGPFPEEKFRSDPVFESVLSKIFPEFGVVAGSKVSSPSQGKKDEDLQDEDNEDSKKRKIKDLLESEIRPLKKTKKETHPPQNTKIICCLFPQKEEKNLKALDKPVLVLDIGDLLVRNLSAYAVQHQPPSFSGKETVKVDIFFRDEVKPLPLDLRIEDVFSERGVPLPLVTETSLAQKPSVEFRFLSQIS